MSQRFLSGLSAALMLSTLGIMPSSYGSEAVANDEGVEENVSVESALASRLDDSAATDSAITDLVHPSELELTRSSFSNPDNIRPAEGGLIANSGIQFSEDREPVKVGEYQNQDEGIDNPAAVIHSHVMDGREAATVYVDGIPVLTLLGDEAIAQSESQTPESGSLVDPTLDLSETHSSAIEPSAISDRDPSEELPNPSDPLDDSSADDKGIKLPSSKPSASSDLLLEGILDSASQKSESQLASRPESSRLDTIPVDEGTVETDNPVQQATAIAARINQVSRDGIDPDEIVAAWDDDAEMYVIKVGDLVLIEFSADVMLPDTTGNTADDVLQATNRIRRQLGAEPLTAIEGAPNSSGRYVAVGPVQFSFTGVASWYGPGFHGRQSASGEIFDQNALTAAHRTLPFGTLVRVTNLNNGASVTVRITDRGPFGGGRVIDLSAGAARAIGMIQSGVATIQADVIGGTP